jgi:hypothetical protein
MRIRYGMPKYAPVWSSLLVLGELLLWADKGIAMLVIAAGMSVFVMGMIAERREWQAKRKAMENP